MIRLLGSLWLLGWISACVTTEYHSPHVKQVGNKIVFHYPDETDIKDISRDVAKWSGKVIIQDRSVRGKVQILSKEPVSKAEAYKRYLAALDYLGLSTKNTEHIVEVYPKRRLDRMSLYGYPEPSLPKLTTPVRTVSMEYNQPTDIKKIIADVAEWSRRRFVVAREVRGKIEIANYQELETRHGYIAFQKALRMLGLTEIEQTHITQIVPVRIARKRKSHDIDTSPANPLAYENEAVSIYHPYTTDIRRIIERVADWSGQEIIIDRSVRGKVQILAPGMLPQDEAYSIFLTALDQVGLGMVRKEAAWVILPKRKIK